MIKSKVFLSSVYFTCYRNIQRFHTCDRLIQKCLKINVLIANEVVKILKCCIAIENTPLYKSYLYNSNISGSKCKIDRKIQSLHVKKCNFSNTFLKKGAKINI